jgi:predicted DNA-binding WGR domain protein
MARRYEYHDDDEGKNGSHKFWEVRETKGSQTYVQWGRCGTNGSGDWFDTKVVWERERKKIREGYKLVTMDKGDFMKVANDERKKRIADEIGGEKMREIMDTPKKTKKEEEEEPQLIGIRPRILTI